MKLLKKDLINIQNEILNIPVKDDLKDLIFDFSLEMIKILVKDFTQKTFFVINQNIKKYALDKVFNQFFEQKKLHKSLLKDIASIMMKILRFYKVDDLIQLDWSISKQDEIFYLVVKFIQIDNRVVQNGILFIYKNGLEDLPSNDVDNSKIDIAYIFESIKIFENEVLLVENEDDLIQLLKYAAHEAIELDKYSKKLNFLFIQNFDDFSFKDIVFALKAIFEEEIIYFFKDDIEKSVVKKELQLNNHQKFLIELCTGYIKKYQDIFKNAIANSYLDLFKSIREIKNCPQIIEDSITGTKKYRSLVLTKNINFNIKKPDQIWRRVLQAEIEKNKRVTALKDDLEKLKTKEENIDKSLKAIKNANSFKKEQLEKISADNIKEIIINEDQKYTDKKRVLQYIPTGDLILLLIDKLDKGKRNARTPIQKEEYAKAINFFENCNINNTQKSLKDKFENFKIELPKIKENIEQKSNLLEKEEESDLENFDEYLKDIKIAIISNLGKKGNAPI